MAALRKALYGDDVDKPIVAKEEEEEDNGNEEVSFVVICYFFRGEIPRGMLEIPPGNARNLLIFSLKIIEIYGEVLKNNSVDDSVSFQS